MAEPVILGANCDAPIRRGEALDLILVYQSEDGSPLDLTSSEVKVESSSPPIIAERAEVSVVDAAAGAVRLFLSAGDTTHLRAGVGNHFRLRATFGPQSDDLSPDIYLQVAP